MTAATLAVFTVSGINVPGAIGAAHGRSAPQAGVTVVNGKLQLASAVAATRLRTTLAQQQESRASRLRTVRASAVVQLQKSAEAARKAAEALLPVWVLPVEHYQLTAGFGDVGLWSRAHTGQDFAAPVGTPIRAIGDGKIIFAGYEGSYGNKIAIEHPDGTVSWYAHMSSFEVTSGPVKAGQVIGRIGATGNVTGPHLHFEIRPHNGDPVPPLTWLREHGIRA